MSSFWLRRAAVGIVAALVCLGVGPAAWAQQTTGSVQGTVFDESKAAVPGATLELRNVATNVTRRLVSDTQGRYLFTFVPPGTYDLRASLTGFKTREVSALGVLVAKNIVVDLVLQPGGIEETVEVTASTDFIETKSAALGTNVSTRQILELPSSSRNVLATAELAPGVAVDTSALTAGGQLLGVDGTAANVNGARRQQNSFYLDGTDNSGSYRNLGLQTPNPEAIQEVQVTTSTNTAEFGKQPGGYFNVITRSGTNKFDGAVFYFGTDESLNANEWSRNRSGLDRPPSNRKQYGAVLGGPIVKDRTFFFASYQRYSEQQTQTFSTTLFPTAKMFAGDFSEFPGQLYNPNNNQPIPGNNLAAAGLLDPVAVSLAQSGLIPTVANLGDRLVWDFVREPRNDEILGKIDHNFYPAHHTSVTYFHTSGQQELAGGSVPDYARGKDKAGQDTLSLRHTWVVKPSVVAEFRGSYAALATERAVDEDLVGRTLEDFGAVWPIPVVGGRRYLPVIEIRDGWATGTTGLSEFDQQNFRLGATVSWVRGSHNFKFGYEAQRSEVTQFADSGSSPPGPIRFQGRFSNRGNPPSGTVPNALFAHSMADFMMGRIENAGVDGNIDYSVHGWSHYAFAQDQWALTPKLTLNLGLRYEIYDPWIEKDGKTSAFVENYKSTLYPNAPVHFAFQGDPGIPEGFIEKDKNNIAPRIHAAYDVFGNGKLALRAGYGLYYAYPGAQTRTWSANEFPWRAGAQGAEARLYDIWGTSKSPVFTTPPTPFPADQREFLNTYSFPTPAPRIIGFDPDFETPKTHQWNLTAEYQPWDGIAFSAGWVANRGRNLLQTLGFNYARFIEVNGQPPSNSATNIQARVPFQTLNRFSIMAVTQGVIDYDALQLTGRMNRGGLSLVAHYTFASAFGDGGGSFGRPDEDPEGFTIQTNNAANPKGEYGRIARKHTFRMYYVYDLPFYRTQQGTLGRILGGWQISGNFSWLSGDPFDVYLGVDANFDATTSQPRDRPDLVGDITYTGGSRDDQMAQFFDKTVFATPTITADYLMGNLPRNALIGPSRWFADMALVKNVAIKGDFRIQLRLEAYNVFNHNNLNQPNGQMNSADFGKILTRSGNRTMQFGAKFYF
jgi:outer membrane receptor protein involved in Fe transport